MLVARWVVTWRLIIYVLVWCDLNDATFVLCVFVVVFFLSFGLWEEMCVTVRYGCCITKWQSFGIYVFTTTSFTSFYILIHFYNLFCFFYGLENHASLWVLHFWLFIHLEKNWVTHKIARKENFYIFTSLRGWKLKMWKKIQGRWRFPFIWLKLSRKRERLRMSEIEENCIPSFYFSVLTKCRKILRFVNLNVTNLTFQAWTLATNIRSKLLDPVTRIKSIVDCNGYDGVRDWCP